MRVLLSFGKILVFILLALLSYGLWGKIVGLKYLKMKRGSFVFTKTSLGLSLFISTIFGWYSVFCSSNESFSDRSNYAYRFVNHWEKPWTIGLNSFSELIHCFSNNPKVLFFSISFLCVFLFLIAYNISRDSNKYTVCLFFCSNLVIYSFYLLKQAPAIAFAAIGIVLVLNNKKLLSLVFFVVSILFHESALILIPAFLVMITSPKSIWRVLSYFVLIGSLFFFGLFSITAFSYISKYLPSVFEQSKSYLNEDGGFSFSSSLLTAIKGLPYYIILLYGIFRRPILKSKIQTYDNYLFMSMIGSVATLLSSYMYWMFRFGAYFYFPMLIFASVIIKEEENRLYAKLFFFFVAFFLGIFLIRYLYQMYMLYGGF